MLRIAVWHNLPSGGGKRQLYSHVKGLVERGHYVEAWCPDTADPHFLPLRDIVTEHVVPLPSKPREFHATIRPARVANELLDAMEEHCRKCAEEINRGGFDVLFVGACRFLRTSPISKYVHLPSTIFLHEPYRWFYEALPELPWIGQHDGQCNSGLHDARYGSLRRLLSRGLKRLLSPRGRSGASERAIAPDISGLRIQARAELEYARAFDSILANSIFSRESILRAYNLPSRVCYLGVDTDYYRPSGEAKEHFVIGLGTIYHAKGVDRAIRAVGAIPIATRPSLVWLGNGAAEQDLENYVHLAARLAVDFRPKLNVSDAEVISHLSRAAAMLYTSRLEPFGLAVLEANACGTAVVGIAEGGVRETILDGVNGFLASDETPVVLGELLERLTASVDTRREMGARARAHVESHWSVKTCIDNIENQLNALYEDSKGKRLLAAVCQRDEPLPANDLRGNLERFEITAGIVHARGWGFIEDFPTDEAQSFLLIADGKHRELHRARMSFRPDVSQHFGKTAAYDNCGFIVDSRTRIESPHRVALIIISQNQVRATSLKSS